MKNKSLFLLIIVFSGLMAACHHHHDHEHDHKVQLHLTGYSSLVEVYAEADPFVLDKESCVIAHFTTLSDFKPLAYGKVTAELIVNGKSVKVTVNAPEEPGIYDFDITPPAKGEGQLTFYLPHDTVVIDKIIVYDNEEEAFNDAEKKIIRSSNSTNFTKEQAWKVEFATELCRVEPMGQVIKTSAQVIPYQGDEQVLVTKSAGIVMMTRGDLLVGKAVKVGQTLFTVSGSDMVDNNLVVHMREASAEYIRAKSEYDRKQELACDRIVSKSELQRARAELEAAESVYNNLQRCVVGGSTAVVASMTGYIKQIMVQNGQYVEAGQPIAMVAKNKNLLIQADVSSRYYSLLPEIVSANFKVNGHVYSLEELDGCVVSYGKSTSVGKPLVPVLFQVSNTIDLLPGSFVQTYIRTRSENMAITVANGALIEEMGNYFVYVQLTPELFEKREVVIGVSDGQRTAIKSGLAAGERIVSKGAMLVKLAQTTGVLDPHAGHHH